MSKFSVRCRNCGRVLEAAFCASCEHCKDSLVVTEYEEKGFRDDLGNGIWKFNWLPVNRPRLEQPGPVVYHSAGLAGRLGLRRLYIAFNGFWPERGAFLRTCTFKELEAAVVFENAAESGLNSLVVASAGNTAKAFFHISATSGFPVFIVVPTMCLVDMWCLEPADGIPILAVDKGDYADSIDVAKCIARTLAAPFEGGVKNIAKRDGLGTVLMEACSVIGRLPEHYFQAVGSGCGALGVWEMAERFLEDGRYGSRLPMFHLAQNLPFAPMVKAWEKESRQLFPEDLDTGLLDEIATRVLSTRYPAYSVKGGVFDALKASDGKMYGITNEEIFEAVDIFEAAEGIDISPAAGVAVAALRQALDAKKVERGDTILLNITGAGDRRFHNENKIYRVEPTLIQKDISEKEIEKLLCSAHTKNL